MKKLYDTFWTHICEVKKLLVYTAIGSSCIYCGKVKNDS